ncbi:hypothetical protein [Priestia koreensis]|uniref:hypothetical protein n=1 Tax=Priestia koreensis TaxID=284581 RepID=UPI00203B4FE4|nr:hypothetical protein [Priestia koreensis]MCM3005825.1 hypothetical protein [Priestia koreensis]
MKLQFGQKVLLKNNKVAVVINNHSKNFDGYIGEDCMLIKETAIIDPFTSIITNESEKAVLAAKMYQTKRELLETLRPNSTIETESGEHVKFFRMNRTRFLAQDLSNGILYNYQAYAFKRVLSHGEPDAREEEIKNLVQKYKGQTILTIYGPCIVEGLDSTQQYVKMTEFGELFTLSLENFYQELIDSNEEAPLHV